MGVRWLEPVRYSTDSIRTTCDSASRLIKTARVKADGADRHAVTTIGAWLLTASRKLSMLAQRRDEGISDEFPACVQVRENARQTLYLLSLAYLATRVPDARLAKEVAASALLPEMRQTVLASAGSARPVILRALERAEEEVASYDGVPRFASIREVLTTAATTFNNQLSLGSCHADPFIVWDVFREDDAPVAVPMTYLCELMVVSFKQWRDLAGVTDIPRPR